MRGGKVMSGKNAVVEIAVVGKCRCVGILLQEPGVQRPGNLRIATQIAMSSLPQNPSFRCGALYQNQYLRKPLPIALLWQARSDRTCYLDCDPF
jgi:hypothetical protein